MSKCVIIGPLYQGEERAFLTPEPGDLLLCADGGYAAATKHGLVPDLVIGDFDSMPRSAVSGCEVMELPTHKDDTDMVVCLRVARERGYRQFHIGGALGGRLDHTLANLQGLADCALRGEAAWLCDRQNRVTVLAPGAYELPALENRKLSLLAYTERVEGVTLTGTEWPLEGAVLTSRYPLGCSNELRAERASLSFQSGLLLLLYSMDAATVPEL